MWRRLDGLRALELGTTGEMRGRLNRLVLAGRKTATAGLLEIYEEDGEALEHAGERMVLVDDEGGRVATVEITEVVIRRFADVPWEFADAEGEGFLSIEDWRERHVRYWARQGRSVDDDSKVVCLSLRLASS